MMIKNVKKLISIAIISLLPINCAFAISLQEAKSSNLVGEQSNGYLGAPSQPSAEVNQLINDINSKRKSEYQRIANSTGSSVQNVEQLAGQKAIGDTQPGRYVKKQGQGWSLK